MYGCEFCKMDKRWNEYCALTGEPTRGAVMCDFEYERCGVRSEKLKDLKEATSNAPCQDKE